MPRLAKVLALNLALLVSSAALAHAVPKINSVSPTSTPANTGAIIQVFCDDCGYSTDRVYFPSDPDDPSEPQSDNWVNPIDFLLDQWVRVRVPETWSGKIALQKQGTGTWSNKFDHEITYAYGNSKWPTDDLPVPWRLNDEELENTSCTNSDVESRLFEAFSVWQCASSFEAVYDGPTTETIAKNDGVNAIIFDADKDDQDYVARVTTWSTGGTIVEMDMVFNDFDFDWDCEISDPDAGVWDIFEIAVHEVGHVLGLKDVYGVVDQNEQKTMFGFGGPGDTFKKTLEIEDASGAEWIYPKGRSDLNHTVPAGWANDIVPQNTNAATENSAILPPELNGNTGSYIAVAVENAGQNCVTSFRNQLFVDCEEDSAFRFVARVSSPPQLPELIDPGETVHWSGVRTPIRGGRHAIESVLDVNEEIHESNESNKRIYKTTVRLVAVRA